MPVHDERMRPKSALASAAAYHQAAIDIVRLRPVSATQKAWGQVSSNSKSGGLSRCASAAPKCSQVPENPPRPVHSSSYSIVRPHTSLGVREPPQALPEMRASSAYSQVVGQAGSKTLSSSSSALARPQSSPAGNGVFSERPPMSAPLNGSIKIVRLEGSGKRSHVRHKSPGLSHEAPSDHYPSEVNQAVKFDKPTPFQPPTVRSCDQRNRAKPASTHAWKVVDKLKTDSDTGVPIQLNAVELHRLTLEAAQWLRGLPKSELPVAIQRMRLWVEHTGLQWDAWWLHILSSGIASQREVKQWECVNAKQATASLHHDDVDQPVFGGHRAQRSDQKFAARDVARDLTSNQAVAARDVTSNQAAAARLKGRWVFIPEGQGGQYTPANHEGMLVRADVAGQATSNEAVLANEKLQVVKHQAGGTNEALHKNRPAQELNQAASMGATVSKEAVAAIVKERWEKRQSVMEVSNECGQSDAGVRDTLSSENADELPSPTQSPENLEPEVGVSANSVGDGSSRGSIAATDRGSRGSIAVTEKERWARIRAEKKRRDEVRAKEAECWAEHEKELAEEKAHWKESNRSYRNEVLGTDEKKRRSRMASFSKS